MIPIIDAHLDLSWNALSFNRDITESIENIRSAEAGMTDEQGRTRATVSLPEMRRANIRLCIGTLLARSKRAVQSYKRSDLDFANPQITCAIARGQLEYYNILQQRGHIQLIRDRQALTQFWRESPSPPGPIAIILSMEGADPILSPQSVQQWWTAGLRIIGLAHYGQCVYAHGTGGDGPLSPEAFPLLREMQRLGMILDLTHTADRGFFQALEFFQGPVLASHNNCRALVPGDRQFSDEQLRLLFQRDAVIGAVMDNWMLHPAWQLGKTDRNLITLSTVADHIDHICQLAGNVRHVGIGSDLDGGYGNEQCPADLDTIFDLQKLQPILANRGYSTQDIEAIFHGNWLRLLTGALPQSTPITSRDSHDRLAQ